MPDRLERWHALLDGRTADARADMRLMLIGALSVHTDDAVWDKCLSDVQTWERMTRREASDA